mgnify:CR=1 FL=1
MKEEIEKVLSDETLTTNEEKVDAIAKSLATLMIPKDKYNDLNTKYKTIESNYTTLSTEYDDFKKSKMTDDEKREAELKQLEVDKKANALKTSELAVKSLFLDNGIKITDEDTELKETLQNIISEDCEKSVKLANNFITLLNKTKVQTENETTTKLLNGTPKPIGGTQSANPIDKVVELKKELEDAIKNRDVIKQTQLTTQIFMAEQEKTKLMK